MVPLVIHSGLLRGAGLTTVDTKTSFGSVKFKSAVMSISLVTPLRRETAAVNALIPSILRRGTESCPDMQTLSAAIDELYGGSIEPVVRKRGEAQCVGFVASFLDDAYTPDGEGILGQAVRQLCELLLRPCTENGVFRADYTEQEKVNLRDRIAADVNDKRQYAVNRLVEEMCAAEPYGVGQMGRIEDVDAITPRSAWEQYRELLLHAQIEVYYSGSANPHDVYALFRETLTELGIPREPSYDYAYPETTVVPAPGAARRVEETLDVSQGKLSMGFRTGGIKASSPQYPALILCNALFGGATTSKLFMNVREKLSLCYYASSGIHKTKGIMVVTSGVEFRDAPRAEREILKQLDACKQGRFEDWELAGARANVIRSLRSVPDSQGLQEDWWLSQRVAELTQSPEELAGEIEKVTVDEIVAAANAIALDTVYFLKGKEG